jgi:hypothetical protein
MCGVMKNEKKDALLKISIRIADKFVGPHLSDFTKKTRKVNKK